jgi:hypothetical protein
MYSDDSGVKLERKNRNKPGNLSNIWKLSQHTSTLPMDKENKSLENTLN